MSETVNNTPAANGTEKTDIFLAHEDFDRKIIPPTSPATLPKIVRRNKKSGEFAIAYFTRN